MTIPTRLALLAALAAGCLEDPCAEYVDYMCDCHVDATACDDLETTYENADAELRDECAVALEDQQEQDAEDGITCDEGTAA